MPAPRAIQLLKCHSLKYYGIGTELYEGFHTSSRKGGNTVVLAKSLPTIRFADIVTYSVCPLAWHLSQLYAAEFISASRLQEKVIQACMVDLYQARQAGGTLSLAELKAVYDAKWAQEVERRQHNGFCHPPIRYLPVYETPYTLREKAMSMLEAFHSLAAFSDSQIVEVNRETTLVLSSHMPVIRGEIPLLEIRRDRDGVQRLHLVDFATPLRSAKASQIKRRRLDFCALALKRSMAYDHLGLPFRLRIDLTLQNRKSQAFSMTFDPDWERCRQLPGNVRQIWNSICRNHRNDYPANPGWQCADCGHKSRCANC